MPGFNFEKNIGSDGTKNPSAGIQPILTFMWRVQNIFEQKNDYIPTTLLKDCTLPDWSFEAEEVEVATMKMKYAKKLKWNDIKLTFYDTVGLLKRVEDWKSAVWNKDKGFQSPALYKKRSIINTHDMADSVINTYTLKGSWPKSITQSALTYTSSDVHNITVTLTYDWAETLSSSA